ncbi:MAG: PEP-CTERM sorting domain-containing protein [Patescibacteria group bacterium]
MKWPKVVVVVTTVLSGVGEGRGGNIDVVTSQSENQATVHFSGPIKVGNVLFDLQEGVNENPVPGDIGWFSVSMIAAGSFIDIEKTGVVGHGGSSSARQTTYNITSPDNINFFFDPINTLVTAQWLIGVLDGNVLVTGGIIKDSYAEIIENNWLGPGPKPPWLDQWTAFWQINGKITAQNFSITALPEPATLVLFALGGVSIIWKGRRLLV